MEGAILDDVLDGVEKQQAAEDKEEADRASIAAYVKRLFERSDFNIVAFLRDHLADLMTRLHQADEALAEEVAVARRMAEQTNNDREALNDQIQATEAAKAKVRELQKRAEDARDELEEGLRPMIADGSSQMSRRTLAPRRVPVRLGASFNVEDAPASPRRRVESSLWGSVPLWVCAHG